MLMNEVMHERHDDLHDKRMTTNCLATSMLALHHFSSSLSQTLGRTLGSMAVFEQLGRQQATTHPPGR